MKMKFLLFLYSVILILVLCSCSSDVEYVVQETKHNYVGSINSDVYHYPDCKWANRIKAENEVWFSDVDEAQEEGYRSCHTCNP